MVRKLLQILLGLVLLGLAAAAHAETSGDMVQLGSGYQMRIVCDGATVRLTRLARGEVRIACSDAAASGAPAAGGAVEQLRLAPGDSRYLFCQGLKLVARRHGDGQVRASCKPATAPEI